MNYKQIAELCNCTVGTVSKAFSGKADVSEEKRQEIFEIAKQNGCFEKYFRGKFDKKVFAIIVPEFKSDHYSKVVSFMTERLAEKNALAICVASNFDKGLLKNYLNYFSYCKTIDGVFLVETYMQFEAERTFPIIAINYWGNNKDVDSVNCDSKDVIGKAIEYFKQNGHEKIAFIGEKFTIGVKNRFIESMRKYNLPVKNEFIIISNKRFEDAGYECMEQIYSLPEKPTAIFAGYDNIALGAMNCIKDHGESVPENFSIISRNDISFASHKNISLTTINSNINKLCEVAIEHMFKKQDRKLLKMKERIIVKPELVIRNSVKDLTKN